MVPMATLLEAKAAPALDALSLCSLVHADLLLYCLRARYRTAAVRICRLGLCQQPQLTDQLLALVWLLDLPERLTPENCEIAVQMIDSLGPSLVQDECLLGRLRHLLARCNLLMTLDSGKEEFPAMLARLNRLFPPVPVLRSAATLVASNQAAESNKFRQSFLWLFLVPGRAEHFLVETWRPKQARRAVAGIEVAIGRCLSSLQPSALFDALVASPLSGGADAQQVAALLVSGGGAATPRLARLGELIRVKAAGGGPLLLLQDDILSYLDELNPGPAGSQAAGQPSGLFSQSNGTLDAYVDADADATDGATPRCCSDDAEMESEAAATDGIITEDESN